MPVTGMELNHLLLSSSRAWVDDPLNRETEPLASDQVQRNLRPQSTFGSIGVGALLIYLVGMGGVMLGGTYQGWGLLSQVAYVSVCTFTLFGVYMATLPELPSTSYAVVAGADPWWMRWLKYGIPTVWIFLQLGLLAGFIHGGMGFWWPLFLAMFTICMIGLRQSWLESTAALQATAERVGFDQPGLFWQEYGKAVKSQP